MGEEDFASLLKSDKEVDKMIHTAYNQGMGSTMQAYFKAAKAIENVLGAEQAKPVIEALNVGISALEQKCQEQRPILKAEIKDEMSKELASKADIARLETEIKKVETELKVEIKYLNTKLNWLIGIMIAAMTLFNPQFVQLVKLLLK